MNIESNKKPESLISEELLAPYFPTLRLLGNVLDSLGVKQVQIGGTTSEMLAGYFTPGEYKETQQSIKNLASRFPESLNQVTALLTNHSGSDLDLYAANSIQLHLINQAWDILYPSSITLDNGTQINKNYGEVYPGGITRLELNIKGANTQTHIDITPTPEWLDQDAENKRTDNAMHSIRVGLQINSSDEVIINMNVANRPDINRPMKLGLNAKDERTDLELATRNLRKIFFGRSSKLNQEHWDDVQVNYFGAFFDLADTFALRNLTSLPEADWNGHLARLSDYQKNSLTAQIFLMAQKDPHSTIAVLQETGIDRWLFGRHLTHHEVIGLLSAPHLSVRVTKESPDDNMVNLVRRSRLQYLGQDEHDGLERFIKAIGYVFGDKRNFSEHFNKGIDVIVEKLPHLEFQPDKILETLTYSGQATETELHRRSHGTELSAENFRLRLLKLKKDGQIETVRLKHDSDIIRLYSYRENQQMTPLIECQDGLPPLTLSFIAQLIAKEITSVEALISLGPLDWELIFNHNEMPPYEQSKVFTESILQQQAKLRLTKLINQSLQTSDFD